MKFISLIINVSQEYIKDYIELLTPIIETFDHELIIINNKEILDIDYDYTSTDYNSQYSNFKEFCFASTVGKNILIVEDGLKLNEEHINALIKELEDDKGYNISFNFITYLNTNRSVYMNKEKVVVYHRGVINLNTKIDLIIEDFRLIQINENILETSIMELVQKKYNKELVTWYSNIIINSDEKLQLSFYLNLEKIKCDMCLKDCIELEKMFIKSKLDKLYIHYLQIRQLLRRNKKKGRKKFLSLIHDYQLTHREIYFFYIIKEIIIAKEPLCFMADLKIADALLQRLLQEADGIIYEYILFAHNLNPININHILIDAYLKYLLNQPERFIKQKELLKIFDILINTYEQYLEKNVSDHFLDESKVFLITQCVQVKELVKKKRIQEAIFLLENIKVNRLEYVKLLQHYMNQLRKENNLYSYVLSICMIVKNEEKNLNRCLSSLQPLLDCGFSELIIIDTGSTDCTKDVAREFTGNVHSFQWTGDFSEARNMSIFYAKGEYVFIIDADEELEVSEVNKVIELFSTSHFKLYNTFTLKIKSFTNLELTQFSMMTQQRIFRNTGDFYYESAVHNQPKSSYPIEHLDIEILHYGYIMTEDIKEKKFLRTTGLLKKELEKDPTNIYFRYQLSSSYAMHNDLKEAMYQVDIFMRLIKEQRENQSALLMYYNNAAAIYIFGHRYNDAEEIVDKALKISPKFIDFIYYKITLLFRKQLYNDVLFYIKVFLELSNSFYNEEVANHDIYAFYTVSNKNQVLRLAAIANYRLKNYKECLECGSLINDGSTIKMILHEIINAYFKLMRYSELSDFYASKIYCSGDEEIKKIFSYFLLQNIYLLTKKEKEFCLSMQYIEDEIKIQARSQNEHNLEDTLNLIGIYDINMLGAETAYSLVLKIMPYLIEYSFNPPQPVLDIYRIKKAVQSILHCTDDWIETNLISENELMTLFNEYISLCIRLIQLERTDLLEKKELLFIAEITDALNLEIGHQLYALKKIKEAAFYYIEMQGMTKLLYQRVSSNIKVCHKDKKSLTKEALVEVQPMEIYCRKRLDYLENTDVHPLNYKNKNICVLHGTIDLTNKTSQLVNTLNNCGIDAKMLNYVPNYSEKINGYGMDITLIDDESKLKRTKDVAAKIIPQFDIFHFHYLTTLTLDHSDLMVLDELGKKMMMHCWGQDVRTYEKGRKINPYLPNSLFSDDDNKKRELEMISQYISKCIINDAELYCYVKDFFNDIRQINRMIDIKKYSISEFELSDKFTIIHPVSSPELQGTEYILQVINHLKQSYNIEFKLVYHMPLEKSMAIYKKADLFIDQLRVGNCGQTALEAMALGKPVICWISDYMKERYPKELPVIIAHPDNLKERLLFILKNKDMLKGIGLQGRKYVEKYHSIDKEIKKIIRLYK